MSTTDTVDQKARAQDTFRKDCARAPFYGLLEAGWQSFVILIAIEYFAMDSTLKAIMAGAHFTGLLLTPLSLSIATRCNIPVSKIAAAYFATAGVFFAVASQASSSTLYAIFVVGGLILNVQAIPLITQIYSNNYRKNERGSRVSTMLLIATVTGILFSLAGGELLEDDLNWWPFIFIFMAAGGFFSAIFVSRIQTKPFEKSSGGSLFENISLIWTDKLFGYLLFAWFLIGLGNLMTMPLRVEYLANDRYGIDASPAQVTLVSFVIMQVARVLSMKIWGRLFDRIHFIPWRISINACFMIGIVTYFTNTQLWAIGIGSAFIGMAFGGGVIAWNLWITRLAPPDKVGAYMSIHTGSTGLRGAIAPFLGYWMIENQSPAFMAITSGTLIGLSMILFAFLWRNKRLR